MLDKLSGVFMSGAIICGLLANGAMAQTAPSAPSIPGAPSAPQGNPAAGCFVAPASLSNADILNFLASPGQLLTDFPSAGLPLSNRVRSLVGSSADALDPILALVAHATPAQAAAIGAGLARAARSCAAVNPEYAARIQDAVAGTDNPAFETAFLGASSETQTAALGTPGAAAGGGAAAIGGPGAGAPGAAGGVNGTGGGAPGPVAAGDSTFSVGSGSRFFASSGGGSSTVITVSPNQ